MITSRDPADPIRRVYCAKLDPVSSVIQPNMSVQYLPISGHMSPIHLVGEIHDKPVSRLRGRSRTTAARYYLSRYLLLALLLAFMLCTQFAVDVPASDAYWERCLLVAVVRQDHFRTCWLDPNVRSALFVPSIGPVRKHVLHKV